MALDAPPLEDAAHGGRMSAERVIVRSPNWLGDCVLSLAALRDVRAQFPRARLEVLARRSVAAIYGAVPEIDGVLTSGCFRDDVAHLRGRFDLAILFPNSIGSALVPWKARIPERWGYATDGRRLLLTRAASVPADTRGRSQVYYYRAMLAGVGVALSSPPQTHLACPDDWKTRADARLGSGRWIAVSPGAAYGTAKRWLPGRFALAADLLARERDAGVAIVGTAGERPLGEWIAGRIGSPVRVLCGETTLPELVGVLAQAELLLTNDSGTMHVAAALGRPVVAIFGPTDWRETAPVGPRASLVREDVHCTPCLLRECPIDHRCMERVSVARVVAAAREIGN
jgi:heptosyltransferase II